MLNQIIKPKYKGELHPVDPKIKTRSEQKQLASLDMVDENKEKKTIEEEELVLASLESQIIDIFYSKATFNL